MTLAEDIYCCGVKKMWWVFYSQACDCKIEVAELVLNAILSTA
jgi:hypothetical protein